MTTALFRLDCHLCCVPQALEQSLDSLALTSFGVMDTTLEEVFLKVSEEDQSLENSDAGETMFLSRVSRAPQSHSSV